MYSLVDFKTKEPVTSDSFIFTGEKDPWEVVMDLDEVRKKLNVDYFKKSPPFVSKYLPFMPVKDYENFVSLKEGSTPLIRSSYLGRKLGAELYFKLESQNPTGSFKDRGSAVDLSVARELGAKGISVASTGNMAASCSCYAASAQIPCFVFVPEGTPPSKLSQSIAFGGRIVQVKGTYDDAAVLAKSVAESLDFFLGGDYAFRVEGQKTAAFELVDQMFFQVPDYVLVPIGCGTNIAAYKKGFEEYKALGFIDKIPKIVGVQAEGASPVVKSFHNNEKEVTPFDSIDTMATAIAVADPLDGLKALDAIYSTDGTAISVTEREMLEAQYELSRNEGHFVECSCATTLAALNKLSESVSLEGKKVVCVLTGDGLKDPSAMLKVAVKPPTIYAEVDDFLKLYESSFFEGKTVSFTAPNEVVFESVPSKKAISTVLQQHFGVSYSDEYVAQISGFIEKFLKKGKPVTFSDLQDIVQDTLETLRRKVPAVISVKDFKVQTERDKKPTANISVTVDGTDVTATSDGVGPVDAVIGALRKACGDKLSFSLVDYKVDIRSQGTNAVVYAEMKLRKEGTISVGTGTSPDIIQASIESFEEAFNGLYREQAELQ